ncbi:hypothetical protein HMPREF0765_3616 [Sphingobacterium spiritivorum ATCC 33300]|uniref:Uncharacterized protein n=1 Tax=Sphingobacterium spiritivorum ATCC 33300 TaxID=525372 RepID=C2G210_SPHSI|nr:hypothetical protein [Sphingobacterium spiritivorum]EEI90700.1 hypothetical protein HMPREF0765_3616 [Sphingobacterium spiritivorum ATCC 33300]
MKALTLIVIILSISFSAVKAQQPTVESLVKSWKVKDNTQSFKAEETYAQLKQKTGICGPSETHGKFVFLSQIPSR